MPILSDGFEKSKVDPVDTVDEHDELFCKLQKDTEHFSYAKPAFMHYVKKRV